MTLRGHIILVSRTDDDDFFLLSFVFIFCLCVVCLDVLEEGGRACQRPRRPPCVDSKTSPCMPAPRVHVEHMCARCRQARGRSESTHGGFSVSRHTPRPYVSHSHNVTHDNDNDNDNDTQRHQLTNLRLNPIQHEKTHQVKTRQWDRLIALPSFSVWWCMTVLCWQKSIVLSNPSTSHSLACQTVSSTSHLSVLSAHLGRSTDIF